MADIHSINNDKWTGTVETKNLNFVVQPGTNMADTKSEHYFDLTHYYDGVIDFQFEYKHSIHKKVSGSWQFQALDSIERPDPPGQTFAVDGTGAGGQYDQDDLGNDHPNKDWDKTLYADVTVAEGDRFKLDCYTRIDPESIPQFKFGNDYLLYTTIKYYRIVNGVAEDDVPN